MFFFYCSRDHRYLHSFPTRRSSDLAGTYVFKCTVTDARGASDSAQVMIGVKERINRPPVAIIDGPKTVADRKSTRLNSSHRCISYAVFCLKKKSKHKQDVTKFANLT